jgi:DNA-binding MarR family transcriptional regulator
MEAFCTLNTRKKITKKAVFSSKSTKNQKKSPPMEQVKEYLKDLNKDFESRARLGIMSVLMVEEAVDFTFLKETLQLTDGNLASHLRALEQASYLSVEKQFVGRRPNTRYTVTAEGIEAFKNHLDALERLILDNRVP